MQIKTKLAILFTLFFVLGCKKDEPESEALVITFIDANLSLSETSSIINFEFLNAIRVSDMKHFQNNH